MSAITSIATDQRSIRNVAKCQKPTLCRRPYDGICRASSPRHAGSASKEPRKLGSELFTRSENRDRWIAVQQKCQSAPIAVAVRCEVDKSSIAVSARRGNAPNGPSPTINVVEFFWLVIRTRLNERHDKCPESSKEGEVFPQR
jgi:hypothetical protein